MRAMDAKKIYVEKILNNIFGTNYKYIIKEPYYKKLLILTDDEKNKFIINENTFLNTLIKIETDYDLLCLYIKKHKEIKKLKQDITLQVNEPKKSKLIFETFKRKYYPEGSSCRQNCNNYNDIIKNISSIDRGVQIFELINSIAYSDYFSSSLNFGNNNFILYRTLYLTFNNKDIKKYINHNQINNQIISNQINNQITKNITELSDIEKLIINTIIKYDANSKRYKNLPISQEANIKWLKTKLGKHDFMFFGNDHMHHMFAMGTIKSDTALRHINKLINDYKYSEYFYLFDN